MRVARVVLSIFFALVLTISLAAQETITSSPQPLVLLQRSLSVLGGAQTLTDVTLSGTVRRVAGSDDDTGTAVFKALASGAGRADLSLSSGQRSEVCDLSTTTPTGTWSGPDHISHPIASHNLVSEPAWFFPAFAIARRLSDSSYVATYVGHETRNGQTVEHIAVGQTASAQLHVGSSLLQHLTQLDFFLDSRTLLPAAITFNIHPDDNALVDIPVEIGFSDFRTVNGAQIPFHVRKLINNSLTLDLQFQNATVNSGLLASQFAAQ